MNPKPRGESPLRATLNDGGNLLDQQAIDLPPPLPSGECVGHGCLHHRSSCDPRTHANARKWNVWNCPALPAVPSTVLSDLALAKEGIGNGPSDSRLFASIRRHPLNRFQKQNRSANTVNISRYTFPENKPTYSLSQFTRNTGILLQVGMGLLISNSAAQPKKEIL